MNAFFPGNQQRRLDKLEKAMALTLDYEEWLAIAKEHDRESGAEDWRHNDT